MGSYGSTERAEIAFRLHNTFLTGLLSTVLLVVLVGCGDGATDPEDGGEDPYSHTLNPGSSAHDLLSDEAFTGLTIEMDYVEGMQPSQESIDSVRTFLERRLNKPGGIALFFDDAIPSPGPDDRYSADEIRELEEEHRDTFAEGSTIAAYYVFMDGTFENENVLGIAYYNTSMAIFEQVIRQHSGGVGEPRTPVIEATTLRHEMGHILGLVNNGSPMQGEQGGPDDHHDEARGAHCTVEGSLMYWRVETTEFIANLVGGGEVPGLEPLGIQDLRANGGR